MAERVLYRDDDFLVSWVLSPKHHGQGGRGGGPPPGGAPPPTEPAPPPRGPRRSGCLPPSDGKHPRKEAATDKLQTAHGVR